MKLIDRCPSCFSSSSDDDYSDERGKRERKISGKKLLAILILGGYDKRLNDQREHYSKFYTAPTIQPRLFCRGKKYEIERKHKVKKRDLLSNSTLSNGAIRGREIIVIIIIIIDNNERDGDVDNIDILYDWRR
jgi:hypothetical protein